MNEKIRVFLNPLEVEAIMVAIDSYQTSYIGREIPKEVSSKFSAFTRIERKIFKQIKRIKGENNER